MGKQFKKKYYKRGYMKKPKKHYTKLQRFAPHSTRPEIKAVDASLAATALTTAGSITLLNGTVVGSRMENRIGSKINLKSVTIRWNIGVAVPGAASDDYARVLVIFDKQPNGALPILADVLQDVAQNSATFSDCLCGLNLANRDRFIVLRDHTISGYNALGTTQQVLVGQDSDSMAVMSKVEYIKLDDVQTIYKSTGATGTITDITSGSLIVVGVGQTAANQAFNLSYRARLRFEDC